METIVVDFRNLGGKRSMEYTWIPTRIQMSPLL